MRYPAFSAAIALCLTATPVGVAADVRPDVPPSSPGPTLLEPSNDPIAVVGPGPDRLPPVPVIVLAKGGSRMATHIHVNTNRG